MLAENFKNDLDRDFSSNSEEKSESRNKILWFLNSRTHFWNTAQTHPQALNHNHNLTTSQPTRLCMRVQANCGSHKGCDQGYNQPRCQFGGNPYGVRSFSANIIPILKSSALLLTKENGVHYQPC